MLDSIDQSLLEQYDSDGFVLVRGLLDIDRDLDPVIAEYSFVLDGLVEHWRREGQLTDRYESLSFCDRLIKVVNEVQEAYDLHFDISLPQADITLDTPIHLGPAVFELLRSPRMLDAVEQFLGPEIYSNPVQHARIKLPEHLLPERSRTGLTAQIAWHQDQGVITSDADQTDMLTVWFPMTSATVESGCLAVVPGSHRSELALHCRSRNPLTTNQVCIPEQLLNEDSVPLPMEPGDVLFMHRKTKHCGLPNQSDGVRWSFDLRYQPTGQPTGREWFPGFVARSRSHPSSELHDPEMWANSWRQAQHALSGSNDVSFNRWMQGDPRCA